MKLKKKTLCRIIAIFLCLCILGISAPVVINAVVTLTTGDQIITPEDAAKMEDVDCILVLGCYVHKDGNPSDMLHDRLRQWNLRIPAEPALRHTGRDVPDPFLPVLPQTPESILSGAAC